MPQPPETWPSNELETLLQAAARDAKGQGAFARALLTSRLYVIPVGDHDDLPSGESVTTRSTPLSLRQIEASGKRGIAAFTSDHAASAALDHDGRWLAMEATDLFDAVRPSTVFLNPFGPAGCVLSPEIVDRLLKFTDEQARDAEDDRRETASGATVRLEAETQIVMGQPEERPDDLIDALVEAIASDVRATAAYIAQILIPDSPDGPHPLIGIEFDGPIVELQRLVTPAMQAWSSRHDMPIDLVDLSSDSEPARYLRNQTTPFFER